MKLSWNRDEDGVIVVYAIATDGQGAPVADFWLKPLIDKLGMTRTAAKALQEQFAEMLVSAHNRQFTSASKADGAERLRNTAPIELWRIAPEAADTIDALVKALEPFAKAASRIRPDVADATNLWPEHPFWTGRLPVVNAACFRWAHTAYTAATKRGGRGCGEPASTFLSGS